MWLFLAAACLISQPASVTRLESPKPRSLAPGALFLGVGCCVFFGRPTVVVAVGCIVACALWFANDLAASRRERRGSEALASYFGSVAAELRAGSTTAGALRRGADALPDSTPENLRAALSTAAGLAAQGGSPAVALNAPEVARYAALLTLSGRHGVALANLIEQAQSQLDTARRHAGETAASLQGPQATAVILACLPLAGILMGGAMGADSLGFLLGGGFSTSAWPSSAPDFPGRVSFCERRRSDGLDVYLRCIHGCGIRCYLCCTVWTNSPVGIAHTAPEDAARWSRNGL